MLAVRLTVARDAIVVLFYAPIRALVDINCCAFHARTRGLVWPGSQSNRSDIVIDKKMPLCQCSYLI